MHEILWAVFIYLVAFHLFGNINSFSTENKFSRLCSMNTFCNEFIYEFIDNYYTVRPRILYGSLDKITRGEIIYRVVLQLNGEDFECLFKFKHDTSYEEIIEAFIILLIDHKFQINEANFMFMECLKENGIEFENTTSYKKLIRYIAVEELVS